MWKSHGHVGMEVLWRTGRKVPRACGHVEVLRVCGHEEDPWAEGVLGETIPRLACMAIENTELLLLGLRNQARQ